MEGRGGRRGQEEGREKKLRGLARRPAIASERKEEEGERGRKERKGERRCLPIFPFPPSSSSEAEQRSVLIQDKA